MDFLKKNYEKVLLGAVLIGLAVAVAFLPFKISSEKQSLQDLTATLTHPKVSPLTNVDLSMQQNTVKRTAAPATVDFAMPHRLFSPMPWQKTAEGRLVPLDETHIGPRAVTIVSNTPLYLTVTLDNIQVLDTSPKYVIGIKRDAAPNSRDRSKKQTYMAVGDKNPTFVLREVQGPPDNPTNVVLELSDGTTASLTKDQPFRRTDGYTVDLRYDPERKSWREKRVGDSISFGGEEYNIVAIDENEVVLSAKSNQKKWTVKRSATSPSPSATAERH